MESSLGIHPPKLGKSTITVVFAILALGAAEYLNLSFTFWFCAVFAALSSIVHLAVLCKYAYRYKFESRKEKN